MHSLYQFISGPMVWIAFLFFITGSMYKIIKMLALAHKSERFIFSFISLKFGLRSIVRWSIPFGTKAMKMNPVMTVVSFSFHICLLIVPVFFLPHIILVSESWNITWWHLPAMISDIMTIVVILSCLFFLFRRLIRPEVKFITTLSDYAVLLLVATPFITGFWACRQWQGFEYMTIAHIISGEIMLIAIPFTRLSHMLFMFFTRAYIGSEFGSVRHAKDW